MTSYFVTLHLPTGMSASAREPLSQLVTRVAAKFSFQGLEDWSVDVKGSSRVLGAEREFHDLTRSGKLSGEMRVYFARKPDAAVFARLLAATFADIRVSRPRKLAPRDWMKAWRRHYKTQVIREGRAKIAIVPAWKKMPPGPGVRISPGQAFGTGTHPTTRLCLRLLLRHAAGAESALDFGAGTGVLLIAARKLGTRSGVAVESDPVALTQCRKNARLNRVSGLRFSRRQPKGARFALVFANVLAPVLLEHRRALHGALKPAGWIFLSGILRSEGAAFIRGFRGRELELVERLDEGDWCAFALRRR